MNVPSVDLSEDEFLVRTSNRITHVSPGALSKPCGFFAEILEENGDLKAGALPVNGEMSSIAGSPEARARKKLTAEEMDFVARREHGIYTHEYYRADIEQLKLLEWFRKSQLSARGYLEGGFSRLLSHCDETKRILEESFPKPAEIHDHVPDGYGIKSVYGEIYRILKKEMLNASSSLDSALTSARLNEKMTVRIESYGKRKALGIIEDSSPTNLHRVYRDRCKKLLDPLREVIPIVKKYCGGTGPG